MHLATIRTPGGTRTAIAGLGECRNTCVAEESA